MLGETQYTFSCGKSLSGKSHEIKQEITMETIVHKSHPLTEAAKQTLRYYAIECRGMDKTDFWTMQSTPDVLAAREHAEALREKLTKHGLLNTYIKVAQRVNAVIVTVDGHAVNELWDSEGNMEHKST